MTATTFTPAPASATAPRPPLTRASADRLFWRQEWARHWPVWLNGLALWIWLFLVPGSTTEESQVLRWSILWTGALALVLAGDDLRRGVDPLVRGLALDPRRRWQMRTAAVLAGSMIFYLAGCAATADAWAWRLWSQVASGDFIGHSDTAPSPFAPWQGLGVIALVAVLCCLAAANFHGMILGLVYAGAVWLASYGCAGSDPALLHGWSLRGDPASGFIDFQKHALVLAGACAFFAPAAWLIGSHHSSRRSPITTSATSISFLSFGIALAGVLVAAQGVIWILLSPDQQLVPLYPLGVLDAGRDAGLTHPTGDPSTREWLWVACLEAVLLTVWWWSQHRARRSTGKRAAIKISPRWLPGLAACLALFHLVAQPVGFLRKQAPEFDQIWPHHLDSPVVTSSQSWEQAHDHPSYSRAPDGYDVCLWAYYPDHQLEPIALQTGTLAMPSPGKPTSQLTLEFPSNALWSEPKVFQIHVAEAKGNSQKWMESDLQFRVEPPRSDSSLWHAGTGWMRLSANFAANRFMPQAVHALPSAFAGTQVEWAMSLVPQRPGQPAIERPWADLVSGGITLRSVPSKRTFAPGVRGFSEALGFYKGSPISLLLVPVVLLGGILLVHTRLGGLALVAIASGLLLVYISADARRIEKELRVSGDLSRPTYQRDLAHARASSSFFHKLDRQTVP